MNPIRAFLEWRERRRLAKVAQQAERERAAIVRAREARKNRHMAFKFLDGDLRQATLRALAAEVGREWKGMA